MKRRLSLASMLVALLLSVSAFAVGCGTGDVEEPATPPLAEEPAVPAEEPAEEPTADPAPVDDVISGTPGTPVAVGMWTVTVTEVEWNSGNDDVSVPDGMQRLEVEIDLTNTSGGALSVGAGDWSMVSGTDVYDVLPADRAQKQGERAIPAGKTEDVDINFAVPDRSGSYVLRFTPAEGGPGTLEVVIQ